MDISEKSKELLRDIRTKVAQYARDIIRDSERSGSTPTEAQLNQILGQYTGQLIDTCGYSLNDTEKNIIQTGVNNFNKTSIIPTYRVSIARLPREVDGKLPDSVTDDWYKNVQTKYTEVRDKVSKKMTELMNESIRTGKTPSKEQVNIYLQTEMQNEIVNMSNLDEQAKIYIQNYSLPWIENQLVGKIYDYSMQMVPRKVTNDFPWTPSNPYQPLDDVPKPVKNVNGISSYTKTNTSFSGTDMVCSIDISLPDGTKAVKVVGSLQTLTYSVHQDKQPVRALGNMNAKDYVFGPRTIAGTLIFAVFNKHWAYEIMDEYRKAGDLGSAHFLMDELPPFQITITAANEYGTAARLALYGVRIVNEGQVMAVNDVYTENTYQFVATDLDYLTAATGYAKPKAIRVPPLPSMTSTPLPSKPNTPVASFDETVPQPEPTPQPDPTPQDPPKPDPTSEPQPTNPYGDMTEVEVLKRLEGERKIAMSNIDEKAANGEYKSASEEARVRAAYNGTVNQKIATAKQYFDEQRGR
ncbi:hypothetical protein [Anaerospora hongkongensis]|uniref:hypothetical protein n=1 Tax=Anaerospora hongkongensis TaxID=244830 RepID=UPI002899C44F|nr:hypothetical protein [Anaerospora hongkongensis]